MPDKPPANLMPALYSHRLHDIQACARPLGYAIAIHGSMQRDLDVLAVPWTDFAVTADELVQSLCDALGCKLSGEVGLMPHGRRAYTLLMAGACFMDLSVTPHSSGEENL
jgi:hypothetical protein